MKRSPLGSSLLLGGLLCLTAGVRAQTQAEFESAFLYPYDLGSQSLNVPSPSGTNTLDSFLPQNDGGYVAIWDDGDGAYVERRDNTGNQLWLWRPPEPRPEGQEVTRAVMASPTHVLWCSAQRWFYLSLTNGVATASNEWSLPYLDATKLVPRDDLLYVLYGDQASVYDTNMTRLGGLTLNWPAGYWRAYGGTWLLDLSTRTNRTLRLARLGEALAVENVQEFSLPHSRAGGYVEHRVLAANASGLLVASSLSWPYQTTTYFTGLTGAGTVAFQHTLDANQMITGAAVLTNGWLISAQFLGEPESRHVLYRVDRYGRPHWQVRFATAAGQQNVVVNTSPPRLLRLNYGVPVELRQLEPKSWLTLWARLLFYREQEPPNHGVSLNWDGSAVDMSGLIGDTNYFWQEPIRPNNS